MFLIRIKKMSRLAFLEVICLCLVALTAMVAGECFAPEKTNTFVDITPNVLAYIGGEHVTIKGPCLDANDKIRLSYLQLKPIEVNCVYLDKDTCSCPVSYLDVLGKVDVKLLVNDKAYKGYIISRGVSSDESLRGLDVYYLKKNMNKEVELKWTVSGTVQPSDKFALLYVWIDDKSFVVNSEPLVENLNYTAASQKVNLSSVNIRLYEKFGVMASKSFLVVAKSVKRGELNTFDWLKIATIVVLDKMDDLDAKCKKWHDNERSASPFMDGLPACWPKVPREKDNTFMESYIDFVKDPSCNPFPGGGSCWYHPQSKGKIE